MAKVTGSPLELQSSQLELACIAHYAVPKAKIVALPLRLCSAQPSNVKLGQGECRSGRWKCEKLAEVNDDVGLSEKLTKYE